MDSNLQKTLHPPGLPLQERLHEAEIANQIQDQLVLDTCYAFRLLKIKFFNV